MSETTKRLKKNISFSAHEKDIYDYLEEQGNASAFIKRLILNQMMIDRGIVAPVVIKSSTESDNQNVPQGTSDLEEQSQKPQEPQEKEIQLTPEEQENQDLINQLPY